MKQKKWYLSLRVSKGNKNIKMRITVFGWFIHIFVWIYSDVISSYTAVLLECLTTDYIPVFFFLLQNFSHVGFDFNYRLLQLCQRTMALPVGRGMFTLFSYHPVPTEPLPIPKLNLTGMLNSGLSEKGKWFKCVFSGVTELF